MLKARTEAVATWSCVGSNESEILKFIEICKTKQNDIDVVWCAVRVGSFGKTLWGSGKKLDHAEKEQVETI